MSDYPDDLLEEEYNMDVLGLSRGRGDPDAIKGGKPAHIKWIGEDKAMVEYSEDPIADWLGHRANQWEEGDRMPDGSDEQGWDIEPNEGVDDE